MRSGFLVVLASLCLMAWGCGGEEPPAVETTSEGFTFFGLGVESLYTKAVRKRLSGELGSDAIATRTTIDLSPYGTDLLERFFPELNRLNHVLNDAAEARVEHDTVKLMYRYAKQKKRPFTYVELLFSSHQQKPLYFKIDANKEGSGIIDAFREKHGEPRQVDRDDGAGKTLYWKDGKNTLIASITTDRFGEPRYHIMMYFAGNIEALIATERHALRQYEDEREKAGGKAFY